MDAAERRQGPSNFVPLQMADHVPVRFLARESRRFFPELLRATFSEMATPRLQDHPCQVDVNIFGDSDETDVATTSAGLLRSGFDLLLD